MTKSAQLQLYTLIKSGGIGMRGPWPGYVHGGILGALGGGITRGVLDSDEDLTPLERLKNMLISAGKWSVPGAGIGAAAGHLTDRDSLVLNSRGAGNMEVDSYGATPEQGAEVANIIYDMGRARQGA